MDRFIETTSLVRGAARHRFNLPSSLCPPPPLAEIMADTDADLAPFLDAKTGIEIPSWAAVADMPVLTTALKRAAAALARDEQTAFVGAAAPTPSTKKGAKPTDASAVDVSTEAAEASDAFCDAILQRERSILRARLEAIAARAAVDASETGALLTAATDRMHVAMKERFVTECEQVATLYAVCAEAVIAGDRLPYDLILSEEGVVIDEGRLLVPPQSPKKFRPPSPEPLAPGLLSLKQISCLVATSQQVTTCEFMSTKDCTDLLQGISGEVGGRYGAAFPPEWSKVTWKQMYESITPMDPHQSGYIDWLELCVGLLIHARPELFTVTPKALAAAAVELEAADGDGDGAVTLEEWMDCPMWFQPKQLDGADEASAGERTASHSSMLTTGFKERLIWHSGITVSRFRASVCCGQRFTNACAFWHLC